MRPHVGMVPRKSSDDERRFGLPPGTQITTARLVCGLIRVYTLVLHQPNPVASRKPYFIGFFASQQSLAEREGLYPLIVRYSDFQSRRKVISQVLGSGTIEDVLGYLHDFPVGCLDPCISVIRGNLVACVPLDDVLHVDMHVDMASKR